MKKKILLALLVTAMLMTTGCGGLTRGTGDEENNNIETVLDMEDLEDGGYYVLRGDEYQQLYAQDTNYELDEDSKPTSSNESHTLWYEDDWSKVPTLYKGDKLIYKTTETLDEEFAIERFEYVGYTVGVSHLKETDSGRYSFEPDPDSLDINMDSDAERMSELTTDTAIIDKVGGSYLRSGNISSGGCIIGLTRGKTYLTEVYAGSILHEYKLKADYIALTSMEVYKSVDYDFLESEILCVNFPDYFNSGYYMINNYGLVRYVNGTSYDDTTDFNVPNVEPSDSEAETEEAESTETSESAEEKATKETVTVSEDGKYTLKVTYRENDSIAAVPSAVFYNDEIAYQLDADGDTRTLTKELDLTAGEYTLEITGLEGREYTYTLDKGASLAAEDDTGKGAE